MTVLEAGRSGCRAQAVLTHHGVLPQASCCEVLWDIGRGGLQNLGYYVAGCTLCIITTCGFRMLLDDITADSCGSVSHPEGTRN